MHPHGYKLNGAINTLFWFITEKKSAGEKKKRDPQIKQNREKSYIERSKVIYNIKRLYKQEPLVYRKQSKVPKKMKKINNNNQSINNEIFQV